MKLSSKYAAKIFNDEDQSFLQVRPDLDGLGLCEISVSEDGMEVYDGPKIIIPWEMAVPLANAIIKVAEANVEVA